MTKELYEKRATQGLSVVITLYDDGSLLINNEDWREDSIDIKTFEETKELANILNNMVKDIEKRKLGIEKEKTEETRIFAIILGSYYMVDVPTQFAKEIKANNDVITKEIFEKMKKYRDCEKKEKRKKKKVKKKKKK